MSVNVFILRSVVGGRSFRNTRRYDPWNMTSCLHVSPLAVRKICERADWLHSH